jgi:hypothetical protein
LRLTHSAGQQLSGPGGASFDSCPDGTANAQIDTEAMPSLEKTVQASELIIVDRVANVLPSVLNNPDFSYVTETASMIALREVLHGTLPLPHARFFRFRFVQNDLFGFMDSEREGTVLLYAVGAALNLR